MNKYLVIIEKSGTEYSAYSPDLPGCIASGPTIEKTGMNMKEAMEFHIEGILEEGYELPELLSKATKFISIKQKNVTRKKFVPAL